MYINNSHLTYCTNIHAGESWEEHFNAIQKYFPAVKKKFARDQKMGIGLRLSNDASRELNTEGHIYKFKKWLKENDAYVFTMNGFPYGNFHNAKVKDNVHAPDWTSHDRVFYTQRLFLILSELLPENMNGGISTSPLSYRHWFTKDTIREAKTKATKNILLIAEQLITIKKRSSQILHLDIEPEPDGVLESGLEFLEWFETYLLPLGRIHLKEKFNMNDTESDEAIKEHIRLCYDVCHFAIGYEKHAEIIQKIKEKGIKIGKIQISAALQAKLPGNDRSSIKKAFADFNESTYLHQVVARKKDGSLIRYKDLPEALLDIEDPEVLEWRSHFHVPIFLEKFGELFSTQNDIAEVLELNKAEQFSEHLEVETYTNPERTIQNKQHTSPEKDSILCKSPYLKG